MEFLKPHAKPTVAPEVVDAQDPPDEPGHEMTGDARVWKTYVREADKSDKEMIEERTNSLDVLLIFVSMSMARVRPLTHTKALQAALFSAVSTAFLIESLGDLKPDPAESSAKTLLLMSQTLAAIANGQTVTVPDPDALDDPPFSPSKTAVLVNLLWLLSLSLSIAVSLVAMLAKEWCYKFLSSRIGPVYEQARRRQLKWNGMQRWKMKEVLTYLPGMMHAALLLFAVGLCLYLWDIDISMAIPVIAVTSIATLVYALATILPAIDHFCPYSTPLIAIFADTVTMLAPVLRKATFLKKSTLSMKSTLIRKSMLEIANAFRRIGAVAKRWYEALVDVPERNEYLLLSAIIRLYHIPSGDRSALREVFPILAPIMWLYTILYSVIWLLRKGFAILLQTAVQIFVTLVSRVRSMTLSPTTHYELSDSYSGSTNVPMDFVTSQMLAWLIVNCENSYSVDIGLQAIAGADNSLPGEPLVECQALKLVLLRLEACIRLGGTSSTASRYHRASGLLVSGGIVQATEDWGGCYSRHADDHEVESCRSSHPNYYDGWRTYRTYAYLINDFGSAPDLNTRTTIAIIAMPPCHWENTCRLGAIKVIQERILEITTVVLKQHLQAASSGLPTVVLDAIVQSTVHYLVGLRPKELEERRPGPSSVLLVQLSHIFFMTYGAPPDTARAVAITLAAAAFATHAYPGGEKPQFNRDTREKRAASVYEYYRAQKSMPKDTVLELFIFGFFGVLPQIDFGDESTQAAATLVNFSQLIRNLPLFDFSRDSTIYTLPRGYSLNAILERSIQSLISFSDKRTSIHEVSLAYNWVPLLIHSFNTVELYIPALLALCRAESVEVQDLCLQFIDRQWTATEPLNPLKSTENRGCLEQLCLALIDRPTRTPVASIAALHFELLVARIIICSASGFPSHFEGQSALRPLLNLQGEFAGRISQPKRHNVRTLLSGLEECCKGNLTAEEHISHTMQSIADFCESTILGFEPFRREEKLKALETLKNQLKPSSDRVARQNQVDPRNAPSNALPNLELLNSETDISVVIA